MGRPPSFGTKLPQFFQTAYVLVQGDVGTAQKTVAELATEKAVLAVCEMIDEHIFLCRNDSERITLWRTCIRPFFQILNEPRVFRSVILEEHKGIIYNVVFGDKAGRLEVLFNFLIDLATKWQPPLVRYPDGSKSQFLELCTAILVKTVDYNSQALSEEKILRLVGRIRDSVNHAGQSSRDFWNLQATNHLDYVQRRLSLVNGVSLSATLLQALSYPNVILPRDLPGALSKHGPRHDNDFHDITKIHILPTMSELMATREEYLPLNDPDQQHLPGIQGLVDRHFRLLREDTVGGFRECIGQELRLLENPESRTVATPQYSIKKHSYNVVNIDNIVCKHRGGVEFHLKLEQPLSASILTDQEREDWWKVSDRLEIGALVCLLQKGTAVFCVVAESTSRYDPQKKPTNKTGKGVGERNVYSDSEFAYVNLRLAEPSEMNLRVMVRAFQSKKLVETVLVEFPGVLLPSFEPILSALQHISKTVDLPFIKLLSPPSDGPSEVTITPPLYTTKPGFAFNLKCLTTDDDDLWVSSEDTLNPHELCSRSTLDEGQAMALLNVLKRSLALIQGPPGTGKSYTAEAIVKVLLASKERGGIGPIVCVCHTNHALDQLLEHLWHGGVKRIIRIGSQSKSLILENLNLHEITKGMEHTKPESAGIWQFSKESHEAAAAIKTYITGLKDSALAQKVKEHTLMTAESFHDAIFGEEENYEIEDTRKSEKDSLLSWIDAGPLSEMPPRNIRILKKQQPGTLSRQERSLLYVSWASAVAGELEDDFISLYNNHRDAKKRFDTVKREVELRALGHADVVGATTSGLAKNLDMFRKLNVKVLLCEEAGEVLESHILAALLPSIEHAILIGDHFQLRPQVRNHELSVENPRGEQYSLDVSLFERLVRPARPTDPMLPFDTLEIQRRMHPSISGLIRETVYPRLTDDEKVGDYPEVVGMRKRLYWFDHDEPEARLDPKDPTDTSRTNDFEVKMVCALVSHLVRQGVYTSDDIAVITPYLGQLGKLRKQLSKSFEVAVQDRDVDALVNEGFDVNPEIYMQTLESCVRLSTVDNFQGEEAKIVIVSLVRSNPERQCGFVKTTNRFNVLLSRAQHGMYIFGNSATYGTVDVWSKAIDILRNNGNIGNKLPLQCPRHKDQCIEISNLHDFARLSPEGGCTNQCLQQLDCGHTCLSKCHAEPLHKTVQCQGPCLRLKEACGHGCPNRCGEPCEIVCTTILKGERLTLPCGHVLTSPRCWQVKTPFEVKCRQRVEKMVPGCHHRVKVPCHENVFQKSFICTATCDTSLLCGHSCRDVCKVCRTRDVTTILSENHRPCTAVCGRSHGTCRHSCVKQCHPGEDCPPCRRTCDMQCSHSKCPRVCWQPCVPCAMDTCSSACPHSKCTMPCAAPCNWIPCSKRCSKVLSCGHQCPSLCGEVCPDVKYCQVCASEDIKSIVVDMIKLREYREINLNTDPCIFSNCGHMMVRSSMDSQLGMSEHYQFGDGGKVIGIKMSPKPFSSVTIKACPHCKGSLRNISRYGRLVRQGLLDESMKKFISWSHTQSMTFEQRLIDEQEKLQHSETTKRNIRRSGLLQLTGDLHHQLLAIHDWVGYDRYKGIIQLHLNVLEYLNRVRPEEQRCKRVFDLVERARRSEGVTNKFEVDSSGIQTRGQLLALTLLFRSYLMVLGDFLQWRTDSPKRDVWVHFKLDNTVKECQRLIALAQATGYIRQEVEARIFFAKLIALGRQVEDAGNGSDWEGRDVPQFMVHGAEHHVTKAQALLKQYPSAAHLLTELNIVEVMLNHGTFYGEVSAEKKRAVWKAIAGEFTATGHWYACARGHPFTVADSGLPMEEAKCPECGATVEGIDHKLAVGVPLYDELEVSGIKPEMVFKDEMGWDTPDIDKVNIVLSLHK
ncbi:P-loop containing nucleoside triphosphate hydrolase protein [Jackrogersella minutella]|nr:P-loop containing nucleoside triphosphate hydrolase protein [Jackrogersella minutella]